MFLPQQTWALVSWPVSVQQAHDGKLYVANYGAKDATHAQQA